MSIVALILSLLIVALGGVGIVSPARFIRIVRWFETPSGLYVGAALRLGLGAALLLAAPDSRAPTPVRIAGLVFALLGAATPFLGRRPGGAPRPLARTGVGVRGWGLVTLGLGLLLAHAVAP